MTRLLVLGGTHFVGRALVEEGLRRGWAVTTVNRGRTPRTQPGVEHRVADRRDPAFPSALGADGWDLVVDTWSQEPRRVRESARLLSGRVGHYGYVSSRSVYALPWGRTEDAETVEASPDSEDAADYAAAKRGAELAVEQFEGPTLIARAGLVLGPYENVGRLPWWLRRVAEGGRVPAPGPPDRPLQYVDARDLAAWMLTAGADGRSGTYNALSRPGHTTTAELLGACRAATGSSASLQWVSPDRVAAAGVEGWTNLPIWAPPTGELAVVHDADTSRAAAAGLVCRPVADTVADTWSWLQAEGLPTPPPDRGGRLGLTPEQEAALLAP